MVYSSNSTAAAAIVQIVTHSIDPCTIFFFTSAQIHAHCCAFHDKAFPYIAIPEHFPLLVSLSIILVVQSVDVHEVLLLVCTVCLLKILLS